MSIEMKIKVTKEILEKSKFCGKGDKFLVIENCAIALAVRDIFPEARVAMFGQVGYTRMLILPFKDNNLLHIELPFSAKHFIIMFDTTNPTRRVELPETEFSIHIPDEVIERIDIDEIKKVLENHPNLELCM